MKRQQFFLIIFCALFILGVFVIISTKQKNSPSKPITQKATKTLSPEAYKKIRDTLVSITLNQNPKIALNTLAEMIKTNNAVARSCHALTHEIGQNAFQKYNDFGSAMKYQDEICNSGYLHGIIESRFAQAADIFSTMQAVCDAYAPQSFIGWECYHGVGHGLMYFTENQLQKSLSLCETYSNYDKKSACVNGVFMENFNTDGELHHSHYLKPSDPLYPCREQTVNNKSDCYLYAPTYYLSLHKNEYQKGFAWCKTAENEFQQTCIMGMGSQIMKENIYDPKFVEETCMQAEKSDQKFCITGMLGLYINHFGRVNEAKKLCSKLEQRNRQTCEDVVASRQNSFTF